MKPPTYVQATRTSRPFASTLVVLATLCGCTSDPHDERLAEQRAQSQLLRLRSRLDVAVSKHELEGDLEGDPLFKPTCANKCEEEFGDFSNELDEYCKYHALSDGFSSIPAGRKYWQGWTYGGQFNVYWAELALDSEGRVYDYRSGTYSEQKNPRSYSLMVAPELVSEDKK